MKDENTKHKLTIRLNKKDYNYLKLQSYKLEKNKTETLRELIRKGIFEDVKEFNLNLKELLLVKRSLANSLNQIAKKLNSNSLENFKNIEEELERLWLSLNQ